MSPPMRTVWAFIATALVFGSCAQRQDWIDRTLVTVDVTGTWEKVGGGQAATLVLEQEGPQVSGFLKTSGYNQIGTWRPIEGNVTGDTFSFRVRDGLWTGDMTVTGEEMSGPVQASPPGSRFTFLLTIRRINSSSTVPSPQ